MQSHRLTAMLVRRSAGVAVRGSSLARVPIVSCTRALAVPLLSSSPPSRSFSAFPDPRSTASQIFPTGKLQRPRSRAWLFLGSAVAFALLAVAADKYYSEKRRALESKTKRPGFPLEMLLAMREARVMQQRAEEEVERFLEQAERTRSSDSPRVSFPSPFRSAANGSSPDAAADEAARSALAAVSPALLESERLYREILSRHLSFRGLDLKALFALAASGAPTPAQAAIGEDANPATKRATRQAIEQMIRGDAPKDVDQAVLPYVLSLLAHNQHLQARVLKELASTPDASPALASAAARTFRESESFFLQSLTLYRHDMAYNPQPYSVNVMQHLGTLYADGNDSVQAQQIWIKCMDMLAAAQKGLRKWQHEQQQRLDDMASAATLQQAGALDPEQRLLVQSELTNPAVFASLSETASQVAEKLALLYRERGEYDKSVAWDNEALAQWDAHAAELREAKSFSAAAGPSAQSAAIAAALQSLPHALHLLNALTADLYASQQREAAFEACSHSLQVLQRIVQLEARARKDVAPASPVEQHGSNGADSGALSHALFLSPTFVEQLQRTLRQSEIDARAQERDFAAARAVTSRETAVPLERPTAQVERLRDEAAATYFNLAKLLKKKQTETQGQTRDAQLALEISKKLSEFEGSR